MDMLVEQQRQLRAQRRVLVKMHNTSIELRQQIDALETENVTRSTRAEAKNMRIKMVCDSLLNETTRI